MFGALNAEAFTRDPAFDRDFRVDEALTYLDSQAPRNFPSFLSDSPDFRVRLEAPREVFTSALVLNALAEAGLRPAFSASILDVLSTAFDERGLVHFFWDRSALPADIDCTGVLLEVMHRYARALPFHAHKALSRIASNKDESGVLRVYLDPDPSRTDRVDPAACVNALYACQLFDYPVESARTLAHVESHLRGPSFEWGTRYYPSPDVLLLFLARLLRDFPNLRPSLQAHACDRVWERLGRAGSALDLAARASAAQCLGLGAEAELMQLCNLQRSDGSWPAAPCFRLGRTTHFFGSESLSTAFALRALRPPGARAPERRRTTFTRELLP